MTTNDPMKDMLDMLNKMISSVEDVDFSIRHANIHGKCIEKLGTNHNNICVLLESLTNDWNVFKNNLDKNFKEFDEKNER